MVLVYQAADDEIPHPPSDADVFKQLPELSPHIHEIVWNGALVYQKSTSFTEDRERKLCASMPLLVSFVPM